MGEGIWGNLLGAQRFNFKGVPDSNIVSLSIQIKVGPSTIVVLSSPAALRDVLDKQSAYTSDRPPHPIADVSFIISNDQQILSNIVVDGN